MSRASQSVSTPCIGVCQLDAQQVCVGCRRTRLQIACWLQFSEAQRRAIMRSLPGGAERDPAQPDATP